VIVPLTGIVTDPAMVVPLIVNGVGTVAPPCSTGAPIPAKLAVSEAGSVSTMDAVVNWLGPVLPIMMVKLVVARTGIVLEPTVLLRLGVTVGVTVSVSAAWQTPATVHDGEGLVLVTLAGGVMTAVLTT